MKGLRASSEGLRVFLVLVFPHTVHPALVTQPVPPPTCLQSLVNTHSQPLPDQDRENVSCGLFLRPLIKLERSPNLTAPAPLTGSGLNSIGVGSLQLHTLP